MFFHGKANSKSSVLFRILSYAGGENRVNGKEIFYKSFHLLLDYGKRVILQIDIFGVQI